MSNSVANHRGKRAAWGKAGQLIHPSAWKVGVLGSPHPGSCIATVLSGLRSALARTHLRGATLKAADLIGANLREADLRGADPSTANLLGADLSYVVGVTVEELLEQQPKSLEGATMPNNQKYADWLKSKVREEEGENSGPQ